MLVDNRPCSAKTWNTVISCLLAIWFKYYLISKCCLDHVIGNCIEGKYCKNVIIYCMYMYSVVKLRIGNNLAPTGSVSNTVWNILGEFWRSEDKADWTRCTKPQWKDLPDLVILFPPSAVYMLWWIESALIRVMVSRLFGAKPLPEPVLTYNQLDPWEQTSVKL